MCLHSPPRRIFRKRKIDLHGQDVRTVDFLRIGLRPTLSNYGWLMLYHGCQPVFLAGDLANGREGLDCSFSIAERNIFCYAMACERQSFSSFSEIPFSGHNGVARFRRILVWMRAPTAVSTSRRSTMPQTHHSISIWTSCGRATSTDS
jgi:hypothetical protein